MTKKITNTVQEITQHPEVAMLEVLLDGTKAIERSEARGQQELVNATVLPRQGLGQQRALWEAMGIKIGDWVTGDDLFTNVTLPPGWTKRPTGHVLWTDLVDDKGRKRASICYKAAFYDRSAHITPVARFEVSRNNDRNDYKEVMQYQVIDGGSVVFTSTPLPIRCQDGEKDWKAAGRLEKQAAAECKTWLVEHGYPDFENPAAYWE